MLTSGQSQRHFSHAALVKMHTQRDEGKSALLSLPEQPPDLPFIKEELPAALGIVFLHAAVTVLADVGIIEKDLTILHPGIAVLKAGLTLTEGFHFHTFQDNASFIGIDNVIIVSCPSVIRDLFSISQFLSTRFTS